jgi:hypothetical protein
MRRWMGGRKLFNGLGSISADPLRSFLALPLPLGEGGMAMMGLYRLPIRLIVLWFVDTILEAGKDVLEEG